MSAFSETTPCELMRLVGTPAAPTILDLRIDDDFALDPRRVPTSRRVPHQTILGEGPSLQGKGAVLICHKGLKLSHGAAALLRSAGVSATVLAGGAAAWATANLPMVPEDRLPPAVEGQTLWVTGHRPMIASLACCWLIRRFIDPAARVLFVPDRDVAGVADRFGATAFGRASLQASPDAEQGAFDSMLDGLQLRTDPLNRFGWVIRSAHKTGPDTAPQAAGLKAALSGLSLAYPDDLALLTAALTLYDGLYHWAREADAPPGPRGTGTEVAA